MPKPTAVALVLALLSNGAWKGPVASPAATSADVLYAELRDASLVPAGRLVDQVLQVDRARFHFEDAELYLLEPVAGLSTGAVVLGDAGLRIDPPNAVERGQVEKYLDEEVLEVDFDTLVLRFTDDTAERLRALAGEPRRPDLDRAENRYRDRMKKALERRLENHDGRVLLDLVDREAGLDSGGYFAAEVDAEGGFTFELEPRREEEVRVFRARDLRRLWDHWSGFHTMDDYVTDASGPSPASPWPTGERWSPAVSVPQTTVDLALERSGDVRGTARLLVEPLRRTAAVRLSLSPILEVTDVRLRDADSVIDDPDPGVPADDGSSEDPVPASGEATVWVQEHVGRGLNEDRWEPDLTVALPRAYDPGERLVIEIAYEGKLLEQLRSRDYFLRDTQTWYPQHDDARRSDIVLTFRHPGNLRIVSGGERLFDEEVGGTRVSRWRSERPVEGMSFHYGRLDSDTYTPEGLPPITVYSSPNTTGFAPGNREKILEDLTGAIRLYEDYFGPVPFASLAITETPGFSGQSFPGFIRVSFSTFGGLHTGEAELFRTHEMAHQWWGNSVGWHGYRDQWMSEGFAQYGAALYVLEVLEEEDKFDEMMTAWRNDVMKRPDIGQRFGMRHYGFSPGVIARSDGAESGPLWIGHRLSSDKTPMDYRLLVYEKGAYVLHMLRMMLYDWETGDDAPFRRMMRSFYGRHVGGHPTTEDFRTAVSETFDEPMDWFFDQWVYGVEVPTFREDLEIESAGDGWVLRGTIEQEDVSEGFRVLMPIRVELEGGRSRIVTTWLDGAETDVEIPLPERGRDYELNPLHAVLGRVR